MVRNRWLISLLFLIAILAVSEPKIRVYDHPMGLYPSWSFKSWLLDIFRNKIGKSKNNVNDIEMIDLAALAEKHQLPTVEGSIIPIEENLKVPHFLRHGYFQQRHDNSSCACEPTANYCNVTCVSLESRCGWTCVHVTEFTAEYHVTEHYVNYSPVVSTSVNTSIQTYDDGCEILECACFAKAAAVLGVAAAAIAVALGVGVPAVLRTPVVLPNQIADVDFQIGKVIPENNLEIPVRGLNFLNDECGDSSVRFQDGNCYRLLSRGPCVDPYRWVTVDPIKLQGRCTPRLCGKGRVFVGRDGLCHDTNDPTECRGGRRLFYSAYGDPICDCPIGQYPFPNVEDDCVPLFTQGPCPASQVVAINSRGILSCTPVECQSIESRDKEAQQLVPTEDGECYSLGSRGPCPSTTHLLGYDIFKRQLECANIQDPSSPYFVSPGEDAFLDNLYNQFHPKYDVSVFLAKQNSVERNATAQRRQDINTIGVFRLPSSPLPTTLLNPCRPGARNGLNYKCTNPLVSDTKTKELLQAVRSVFNCPTNSFLQATGLCVDDSRTASCGPSYRFNQATRQCRSIF